MEDAMKVLCFFGLATIAAALTGSVTGAATPPSSAQNVASQLAAATHGMKSYRVDVTISAKERVGFLRVPITIHGLQFYKSPARVALQVNHAPAFLRSLVTTVENLGSLQVAPPNSGLSVDPSSSPKSTDVTLTGTWKERKNDIRGVTLKVNKKTFVVDGATITYLKGQTLTATFEHKQVGKYLLVSKVTLDGAIAGYKGTADVSYGNYSLNVPVNDSVFSPTR
jgi:hypothetical protein